MRSTVDSSVSRFAPVKRVVVLGLAIALFFVVAPVSAQKKGKKPKPEDQIKFGVQMAQRGLWSEALFRFKQAHRRNPDDAKILNNLAISYEALGLFDQALDHYRQALEKDPTNKVLRRNYARFVEFYQAFNPPEEGDPADGGESGGEAESETEEDSEPSSGDPNDRTGSRSGFE